MAEYNNTKHRQEILTLFQRHHLLTAADIKQALPQIDTVTIYRTLKRLADAGVVKEVKHSTKFASYELITDHQHFVCRKCGAVIAISVDQPSILKKICTNAGVIEEIHLDVVGVCKSCSTA